MNMIGKFLKTLLLLILLQIHLNAQITVSAYVDKRSIPLNDTLTFTISISGENISNPKILMPQISDFNIYSSGKTSNISITNGKVYSTIEYNYVLSPRKTGKFQLPSVTVIINNQRYKTPEIAVTVTKPSMRIQSNQSYNYSHRKNNRTYNYADAEPIFVKAYVDKRKAYAGEQITLRIKFYTSIPITSNPQYIPPNYENLMAEDLPPINNGTEIINGKRYYFAEIKTALFGIIPGKAKILPAKFLAYVQNEMPDLDPFDPNFIQKFFASATQTKLVSLETKPITLTILPLPSNQPEDFSNAVGNFFISAKIDNPNSAVGQALNLVLTITGKGNIKMINPPTLKLPDFKLYDTLVSDKLTTNNGIIGGIKKITYIISPLKAGNLKIPSINFTFFNIDNRKYETISTEPIYLKVNEAKNGKSYEFNQQVNTGITEHAKDINYIYEDIPNSYITHISIKIHKYHEKIIAVLILILLLNFTATAIRNKNLSNPVLYAYKNALARFKNKLRKSQKSFTHDKKKALSELYDAIFDYFSDKLKQNTSHLTYSKIENILLNTKPSLSKELLKELKDLIEKIEFLNYTSTDITAERFKELYTKALSIIEKLDREIEK